MNKILIASAAILLSACASSTMKNYVGSPISEVIMDHGQPDSVMDTGHNQRAVIWKTVNVVNKPAVIESGKYDDHFENTRVSRTTLQLPEQETNTCYFTFYTQDMTGNAQSPADWIITGYRKPNFACQQYF